MFRFEDEEEQDPTVMTVEECLHYASFLGTLKLTAEQRLKDLKAKVKAKKGKASKEDKKALAANAVVVAGCRAKLREIERATGIDGLMVSLDSEE